MIKGYGIESDGTPVYMILKEDGRLDRKTAKKANEEYTAR